MASKPTSLMQCLRELWPDFQITNENVMNPTSDTVIKFYERFICGQLQIEIETLKQQLLEKSSCRDTFTDILNIYTLYMCSAIVIKNLGLHELFQTFGLTDLINPMRKNFKVSLTLLSNCVIYVATLQELMEEIKNKIFQALQSFKENEDKIEELKEKKNNIVLLHFNYNQKNEDLLKYKDSLHKQIRAAQKEFDQSKENGKLQELTLNQIQDEYEILDAKLNDLCKIEEKLKSEIVYDYKNISYEKDRLRKEKDKLLAESDEYHPTMKQKMQTISCYRENLNCTNQFLETMPLNKLLEKYEICDKNNNKIKEHQIEIKSLQETESLDLVTVKQFQDIKDSLKREIQECTMKHENKINILDKNIEKLQSEIKLNQNKKNASIIKCDELNKEIQKIKECSQQYEKDIENQNAYYDEKYKQILELKAFLDNKVKANIYKVGFELNLEKKK